MNPAPRRLAVVGSGVAGLTAAHVAAKTSHVTLYEADDRLGGHADTHDVDGLSIDTGFIVHNRSTYPTLLRLFAELGVQTQPSEMSMSVRDGDLEYAGALGAQGLFPSRANATRPRYLLMLAEIPRFHRRARALLESDEAHSSGTENDQPLRAFLSEGRFTSYFVRHFVEPLVAAVWSCDPEVALDYPARYLFQFLSHHGMLSIKGSPQWRTVTGGSRQYVELVAAGVQEIRVGTKVTSIAEVPGEPGGVEITDGNGRVDHYDAVVIAAHPAQALAMLAAPTDLQQEVLSAMPYSPNVALLHTDTSVLPKAQRARASWNFLRPAPGPHRQRGQVTVTYDLTRLQRLDTDTHYLVTLGGEDLVDPATVIDRMEYEHPLYNSTSVAAQARLPRIGTERIAFAGAYHGWGFHEDGARSGAAAAERLGLIWPEPTGDALPEPGTYRTEITHTRRKPIERSFTHTSSMSLVDLDDLPDHGVLGRVLGTFESRDHLGSADQTIRANLDAFLATRGVDVTGGHILMATNARAFGNGFNPISVFWCFDRNRSVAGVVLEVRNTYGDRHAYLVHPDEAGRAHTDKQLYVSPFHGTDGSYDIRVPIPGDRLVVAIRLKSDDGTTFSAALSGTRTDISPLRAAPAALRGALLIRVHGVWLWLRRLPIRPRPTHAQEGVQ